MGDLLENKACPKCSTSGNGKSLAVYTDGEYCYECGHSTRPAGVVSDFYFGKPYDIQSRKLTKESLEKYNTQCFSFTGKLGKTYVKDEPCVGFFRYENGVPVQQKIRAIRDRSLCTQRGDTSSKKCFGMHAFTPSKKIGLIITEGEFDAIAAASMMGNPAVSIGDGAQSAKEYIKHNIDWISGWSHVILCFDADEPGKKAVQDCIDEFEVGKVRVAHLPLKDANDMLKAGKTDEFKRCIWNAEIIRPDTIVFSDDPDLLEKVLEQPQVGEPWAFPSMNKITHGMRWGDLYILGGGAGTGKTEFIKELIFGHLANDIKCGLFSFEQEPEDTMQRIAGAILQKRLQIPGQEWWDKKAIKEAIDTLEGNLALYKTKGKVSLTSVVNSIRFLAKAKDTRFFVIDNLTALAAVRERGQSVADFNEDCGGQLNSLCKELKICIMLLVHLNDDKYQKSTYVGRKANKAELNTEGLTWDTGRMPNSQNIKYGDQLEKLSSYTIFLARNKKSKDNAVRRLMTVKFAKTRLDEETGLDTFYLLYNPNTGRLEETENICYNKLINDDII